MIKSNIIMGSCMNDHKTFNKSIMISSRLIKHVLVAHDYGHTIMFYNIYLISIEFY